MHSHDRVQLKDLAAQKGLKSTSKHGVAERLIPEWARAGGSDAWMVTLSYKGRKLTVPFFMGSGHHGNEQQAYEVIGALLSDVSGVDASSSFEGWAGDLGYDTDSRAAEAIFKSVQALAPKVHRLLGADFDEFSQAEY